MRIAGPLSPDAIDAIEHRLHALDRFMDAPAAARRAVDIAEALTGGPPTVELFDLLIAVALWGRYRCTLRDNATPETIGIKR